MRIGTIVQAPFGRKGIVVSDPFCPQGTPEEMAVVYDGTDHSVYVPIRDFVEIGIYNPLAADIDKCGGGRGDCTCKWLGIEGSNTVCLRFSKSRGIILSISGMRAKGSPQGFFPRCQAEILEGIASGIPAGPKKPECK